jgi:hypothetical protein
MQPFDPEAGVTVLAPEAPGAGYWVGCPSVLWDDASGRFLLTYRRRRPRGSALDRGWRCAVAESTDGVLFRDVWVVTKDELFTSSMERFSLLRTTGGVYRLYLSYVDPSDSRWRIDSLAAASPSTFRLQDRAPLYTAESTGTEGVKDPYVVTFGDTTYLYSIIARPRPFTAGERAIAHATGDIHNTGLTRATTSVAVSTDGGASWAWLGDSLVGGDGWDAYEARLNCVLPLGDRYVGLYDGSASVAENYEERCGVAVSRDARIWVRATLDGPWVVSPHASGSLRYQAIAVRDGEVFFYYEYARSDAAHELRMQRFGQAQWEDLVRTALGAAAARR